MTLEAGRKCWSDRREAGERGVGVMLEEREELLICTLSSASARQFLLERRLSYALSQHTWGL